MNKPSAFRQESNRPSKKSKRHRSKADRPRRVEEANKMDSIFESMPCYGSHGPGNTIKGQINREMCPYCNKIKKD